MGTEGRVARRGEGIGSNRAQSGDPQVDCRGGGQGRGTQSPVHGPPCVREKRDPLQTMWIPVGLDPARKGRGQSVGQGGGCEDRGGFPDV